MEAVCGELQDLEHTQENTREKKTKVTRDFFWGVAAANIYSPV